MLRLKYVNGFMGFSDYILSESISPKRIAYGSDLKDGKWIKTSSLGGNHFTFFESNDNYYCVIIGDNCSVGFAVGSGVFRKGLQFLEYMDTMSTGKTNAHHALSVFSEVFYIILRGLDVLKLKDVYFDTEDPSLSEIYGLLMKNKFFLAHLEKSGFDFVGVVDKRFRFRRRPGS